MAKPLFENVTVKFGGGKSRFMKILGGDLGPTAGTVAIDKNERVGKLRQVLDVVLAA
jgi:ATPase subunit of ABC transporter with duplicated ATPase domains